ncbi:MAG: hypothetical protein HYW50_04005 [Candidatus Diapherotrites archaeon]|nr:hypothetical protein [Candidatus Diapherotrites archaeon]
MLVFEGLSIQQAIVEMTKRITSSQERLRSLKSREFPEVLIENEHSILQRHIKEKNVLQVLDAAIKAGKFSLLDFQKTNLIPLMQELSNNQKIELERKQFAKGASEAKDEFNLAERRALFNKRLEALTEYVTEIRKLIDLGQQLGFDLKNMQAQTNAAIKNLEDQKAGLLKELAQMR